MELILYQNYNFSFQFYLRQAEDNSTVNIYIQFSSYPNSTVRIQFSSAISFQFDRRHSVFLRYLFQFDHRHSVFLCYQFSAQPSAFSFPVFSSTVGIQFSSAIGFQFDRRHSVFLCYRFSVRPSAFSFPLLSVFSSTVGIQFSSAIGFQFARWHIQFFNCHTVL